LLLRAKVMEKKIIHKYLLFNAYLPGNNYYAYRRLKISEYQYSRKHYRRQAETYSLIQANNARLCIAAGRILFWPCLEGIRTRS